MKNNQKGFVAPLLITIIVLLILGGGIYLYSTSKSVSLTTNTVDQATSSADQNETLPVAALGPQATSPAATQAMKASDGTNGIWKTYTDPNGEFSFQYPGDSSVEQLSSTERGVRVVSNNTKDGQEIFEVYTKGGAKYELPSTSHSDYVYTYDFSTNTFTARNPQYNTTAPITNQCPQVKAVGDGTSPITAYVTFLSGTHNNAAGNDDSGYTVLTNKGNVINLDFNDTGTDALSQEAAGIMGSLKRLIGGTTSVLANCHNKVLPPTSANPTSFSFRPGATLTRGSTYTFDWAEPSNIAGVGYQAAVGLESVSSTEQLQYYIGDKTALNNPPFTWTVPADFSPGQYKVNVSYSDKGGTELSSDYFTIQ